MKTLLPLLIASILFSCAKSDKKPDVPTQANDKSEVVTADTNNYSKIKVSICYSTTISSGLSSSDVQAELTDTSYCEITKNDTLITSWKSNWNIDPNHVIDDLNTIHPCKQGDIILCTIIHRTTRQITDYRLSYGVVQHHKQVGAQTGSYLLSPGDKYYDPNKTSFIFSFEYSVL